MGINVTIDQARAITGAPTDLISNDRISDLIAITTNKSQDLFQVKYEPTKKIEILTGGWKDKIVLDEYFPLKVLALKNGTTSMDLQNIYCKTDEGILEIYGDTVSSQYSARFSGYDVDIRIKYLYGAMEPDTTAQTEIATAVTAGSSVSVTVDSSSNFNVGDYVFFQDLTRAYELAQITAISDSTTIVVDLLNNDYEVDGLITKAKTMDIFNQYVLYETAVSIANEAVGGTYTIATGYTYPEYSVQKGVPYTHWQNSLTNNIKQRDIILKRIHAMLGAIV